MTPDRVVLTAGTSEGIEIALNALVESGRRSARADADLSAVHGGHAKIAARTVYYRDRSEATGGCRTSTRSASLITPRTRALVVIDPEQSDRRHLPRRRSAAS